MHTVHRDHKKASGKSGYHASNAAKEELRSVRKTKRPTTERAMAMMAKNSCSFGRKKGLWETKCCSLPFPPLLLLVLLHTRRTRVLPVLAAKTDTK
jgi:hypothetical protein